MSFIEAQLFFARAVLLILLYTFLGSVGLVTWRELRSLRKTATPLDVLQPGARFIVLDGGESDRPPGTAFPLQNVTSIGRDIDNSLVFVDATVSGRHAVANLRDSAWWIEDLGSTNGTFVNGLAVLVDQPVILRSGDVLRIGGIRLRLVSPGL